MGNLCLQMDCSIKAHAVKPVAPEVLKVINDWDTSFYCLVEMGSHYAMGSSVFAGSKWAQMEEESKIKWMDCKLDTKTWMAEMVILLVKLSVPPVATIASGTQSPHGAFEYHIAEAMSFVASPAAQSMPRSTDTGSP